MVSRGRPSTNKGTNLFCRTTICERYTCMLETDTQHMRERERERRVGWETGRERNPETLRRIHAHTLHDGHTWSDISIIDEQREHDDFDNGRSFLAGSHRSFLPMP